MANALPGVVKSSGGAAGLKVVNVSTLGSYSSFPVDKLAASRAITTWEKMLKPLGCFSTIKRLLDWLIKRTRSLNMILNSLIPGSLQYRCPRISAVIFNGLTFSSSLFCLAPTEKIPEPDGAVNWECKGCKPEQLSTINKAIARNCHALPRHCD